MPGVERRDLRDCSAAESCDNVLYNRPDSYVSVELIHSGCLCYVP